MLVFDFRSLTVILIIKLTHLDPFNFIRSPGLLKSPRPPSSHPYLHLSEHVLSLAEWRAVKVEGRALKESLSGCAPYVDGC